MEFRPVEIDENRNYWFLRTQSGSFFEAFLHDGFIAIGWDAFTDFKILSQTPQDVVVERIRMMYPDERRPKHAYNQMIRFVETMAIGDVVVIPGHGSRTVAFGVITSDPYVESDHPWALGHCPFRKRRKVEWQKVIHRTHLDKSLYPLTNSQHTLTSANRYADVIDRTLHSFFVKGKVGHLILNVTTTEEISALDFIESVGSLLELVPLVNEATDENLAISDFKFKSEVHSPGHIELYVGSAAAITVLGLLIVMLVGGKHKFSFSWAKEKKDLSSEMISDGFLEKVLKMRTQQQESRLAELEMKHRHKMELLKLKLPEELQTLLEDEEE